DVHQDRWSEAGYGATCWQRSGRETKRYLLPSAAESCSSGRAQTARWETGRAARRQTADPAWLVPSRRLPETFPSSFYARRFLSQPLMRDLRSGCAFLPSRYSLTKSVIPLSFLK